MTFTRLCGAAIVFGAAVLMAACATAPDPSKAGPPKPLVAKQTSVVDIQVFRDETVIRMTNTTAKPLGVGRMWINNWFSRSFDGLGVGQTVEIPLNEFRDQYGEAFHAGGFFAADRPNVIALAQIETGGELIGLVVVGERMY